MTNTLVAWLFAMMVQLAPPDRLAAAPQIPGWEETEEQKRSRYEEIAASLFDVTYDQKNSPLYAGPDGRAKTAALLLSIAYFESGFAHDVDKGPCYRGDKGGRFRGRCDGGLAACLMQVRVADGTTWKSMHGVEGLSQKDLFEDRKACFSVGLHMVRKSFASCSKLGPDWALNVYASGSCKVGLAAGRSRIRMARKLLDEHPLPGHDSQFLIPIQTDSDGAVSVLMH